MNDNHPKAGFHREVVDLIHQRYPRGVDMLACSRVLGALAAVAGDIMARAYDPEKAYEGFTEIAYRELITNRRQVNVVMEPRN